MSCQLSQPRKATWNSKGEHDPVWHLKATDGLLIGGYGDNFSYDGSRVVPIGGEAEVLLAERTAFYSPMEPSKGYIVAPDEWELHFVAHSEIEDANNFPPHTVWIHLNFVAVEELPATLPVTGGDAPDASIPYLPLLAVAAGLLLIGGGLVLRRRLAVAKR